MRKLLLLTVFMVAPLKAQDVDTVRIVHKNYTTVFSKTLKYPLLVEWWDTKDNLAFVDEKVEENMAKVLENERVTEQEKRRSEIGVEKVLFAFPQYKMYTTKGSANLLDRTAVIAQQSYRRHII